MPIAGTCLRHGNAHTHIYIYKNWPGLGYGLSLCFMFGLCHVIDNQTVLLLV